MFMDGYRAMIQSADMLRWAPGVFGPSPTGQKWDWDHRIALNQLARQIENLESALEPSRAGE